MSIQTAPTLWAIAVTSALGMAGTSIADAETDIGVEAPRLDPRNALGLPNNPGWRQCARVSRETNATYTVRSRVESTDGGQQVMKSRLKLSVKRPDMTECPGKRTVRFQAFDDGRIISRNFKVSGNRKAKEVKMVRKTNPCPYKSNFYMDVATDYRETGESRIEDTRGYVAKPRFNKRCE